MLNALTIKRRIYKVQSAVKEAVMLNKVPSTTIRNVVQSAVKEAVMLNIEVFLKEHTMGFSPL